MSDINQVCISGRMTREPDLRVTAGGLHILGLGVAVNESRKNQAGQWEDYTNFLDVVVMGKRAEALQGILTKGMQVTVSGRLRWSQWEKDGQKRSKVEILADNVVLPPKREQSAAQAVKVSEDIYDYQEDIPF